MAGLKILLAVVLSGIVLMFFPAMIDTVMHGPDRLLSFCLWLVLFALASAAISWALPKRNASA